MQASPNEPSLNVLIDSATVASNLAYGQTTSYLSVKPGSRTLQLEPSGSTSPVIDDTISLSSRTDSTAITIDSGIGAVAVLFADDNSSPSSGNAKLRVINASPLLGGADLYVVAPGSDLNSVSPTITNLLVQRAAGYQSLVAGSYEVLFTLPGSKFVLLDAGTIGLSSGQVRTLVAVDNQSNGPAAVVLDDLH